MMVLRRTSYLVAFAGLAMTAALAIARIGEPQPTSGLIIAVVVAALAGAPGLIDFRAWPVAAVLLPLGAYLLVRIQMPLPDGVEGIRGQAGHYLDLLRDGGAAYARQRFPLDLAHEPEIRLLLMLAVYMATGLAAFVALTLRTALPAVVVLLVPLGFGLTVDEISRVIWLPLLFVVLATCVLMLERSLERTRWRTGDTLAGAATAATAALLALGFLGSTSIASSTPWQDWRLWGKAETVNAGLAFNWMQNYPDLLGPQGDIEALKVTSPVGTYWRANSLDRFNGIAWMSGWNFVRSLPPRESDGSYTYTTPLEDRQPAGEAVKQVFEIRSVYTDYFLAGGAVRSLKLDNRLDVYSRSGQALRTNGPLGPGFKYEVTAVIPKVSPADVVDRGRAYPADTLPFTQLPFPRPADITQPVPDGDWVTAMQAHPTSREWIEIYRLNRLLVGNATDPYEITLRLERALRSYTYSLSTPVSSYRSPYAAFLFDTKTGYCQHFAGAMAVLLRFNGIPTRVALGFTPGERTSTDTFAVSTKNAHAWVEVYFPEVGWVPFDPTPGRSVPGAGPSSTTPGFLDPFRSGGTSGAPATSAPRPEASRGPSDAAATSQTGPEDTGSPAMPPALPIAAAIVALLLAWPLGRAAVHWWRVRRGPADRRLRTVLSLVYAALKDHGVEIRRSQTLHETAGVLRRELGVDAFAAFDRVEAVLYGGRAATEQDLAAVAALRREVERRLRARSGRVRTILAWYGVPALTSRPTRGT